MDDEAGGAEHPAGEGADVAVPEPTPRNPRQIRTRRRRRRRQLGTLLFLLVAAGVFAAAYFTLAGGGSSSNDASRTTSAAGAATTTGAPPFVGTYKTTSGINVRQGAGTNFPTVGTIEQGRTVTAVCVAQGQPVDTPSGSNSQWLKVAGSWPVGYVSAGYVTASADLSANKIPACPAA